MDSAVHSDCSTKWQNCSKESQRPPRPRPQGRTEAPPRGSGCTRTRAEFPSPEVRAGCSTVLAASASATSFPQEVSLEEIEWTSTSRVLSCDGGGSWTRGGTEVFPAPISASWPAGSTMPKLASASMTSATRGAPTPATMAFEALRASAPVASALEV